MPPEELRLRLTHHERDSDKFHAVRAMLDDLLTPLPHLKTPNSARQHDLAGGAGAQGRHSLQGVPRILRDRREEAPPTAPDGISGRCATPATSLPRRSRPSQWSFTTEAATTSTSCCAVSRAPREELGEDSDNDATESEAEAEEEGSDSTSEDVGPMPMAKAAPKPKAAPKAKAAPKPRPRPRPRLRQSPQRLVRPAGRDQAGRLQPPLPPSPLQVGREVPADELVR